MNEQPLHSPGENATGVLDKVEALRTDVKRRKEETYAQRSREGNVSRSGPLRDRAGELRNLQTQLDDLWNGICSGVLDSRAASVQLDFLQLAYAKLLGDLKQDA